MFVNEESACSGAAAGFIAQRGKMPHLHTCPSHRHKLPIGYPQCFLKHVKCDLDLLQLVLQCIHDTNNIKLWLANNLVPSGIRNVSHEYSTQRFCNTKQPALT